MKSYTVVFLMEDIEAEDQFDARDKALELIELPEIRKDMIIEETRSGSE